MLTRPSVLSCAFVLLAATSPAAEQAKVEPLTGTRPLTFAGDLSLKMVDDLHVFADRLTAESVERRARHWKRDFSSREAYEKSVEPNRARLRRMLGVDSRSEILHSRGVAEWFSRAHCGSGPGYQIYRLRVPTFAGFVGELIELAPGNREEADRGDRRTPTVIVVPDADQSPEEVLELNTFFDERVPKPLRIARRLAESGVRVVVPRLISRADAYSYTGPVPVTLEPPAGSRLTNASHREHVYRQAFEMGRSMIGYEVQLLQFAAQYYARPVPKPGRTDSTLEISIFGYGEGGLLALYTAAIEPTVGTTVVSGYFGPREGLWSEPIDRNVWGLLDEFGDAELASLIAPRMLVIEPSEAPSVTGPPPERDGRKGGAPGVIATPSIESVRAEVARAKKLIAGDSAAWDCIHLLESPGARSMPGSDEALRVLLKACSIAGEPKDAGEKPGEMVAIAGLAPDSLSREQSPLLQLVEHTQALLQESEYVRKDFWKNADRKSRDPAKWTATLGPYRTHLYDEVLGRFDLPKLPPNARTRKIYDTPKYVGYEVVLDVFGARPGDGNLAAGGSDVWAFGILLVPKDMKPGEKRPVVVCQHGLEGRPEDTIRGDVAGARFYHEFAAKLADRGFVTFSPQNPYIGKNHFRQLVRKLNPLKKSLWSVIVPQHEQITDWLAGLDFVDDKAIGFYGLSYGGKTAMRVPALVERYCLSICSGDFNEWIRKCTSVRDTYSYIGTPEYEMFEFDLGHTFNYAEMAYLIAPRPFMVERGHRDGVGVDEWVSYEFAKVRMLYADLKIPERTEIEYFDGPHEIHAVGTFAFLHRHLNWPVPKE